MASLIPKAVSTRLLAAVGVVEAFGIAEEGIFRKAGPKHEVDALSALLVEGEAAFVVVTMDIGDDAAAAAGDVDAIAEDGARAIPLASASAPPLEQQLRNVTSIHSVAGALKRVLRNHHPLLCCELYAEWVASAQEWDMLRDSSDSPAIPVGMQRCIARLPAVHRAVLQRLLLCVGAVIEDASNRMSMKSVAITLGINIVHSGDLMALPDVPAIENVLNALLDIVQLTGGAGALGDTGAVEPAAAAAAAPLDAIAASLEKVRFFYLPLPLHAVHVVRILLYSQGDLLPQTSVCHRRSDRR